MSILVAFAGNVALAFFILWGLSHFSFSTLRILSTMMIISYVAIIFLIAIGLRSSGVNEGINLIPLKSIRQMFGPVFQRLKEWGFPKGLRELKWIGYSRWEELILNLLMLVPIGLLLPLSMPTFNRWWKVVIVGLVISLMIEWLQLVTHRGWFDIDDILLNSLGTCIGWTTFSLVALTTDEKKNVPFKEEIDHYGD